MKRDVPLPDAWRLLNPCPTVLVSARYAGRNHVCAVAWCMPLDFKPPKAALVLAAGQSTSDAVTATGELVINIPGVDMAGQVLAVGTTSGKELDKFRAFGLTTAPSRRVKAPGIAEALAILECRVLERVTPFGKKLRRGYDLLLVEILRARAEKGSFEKRWLIEKGVRLLHHLGSDGFEVSGRLLRARKPSPRKP